MINFFIKQKLIDKKSLKIGTMVMIAMTIVTKKMMIMIKMVTMMAIIITVVIITEVLVIMIIIMTKMPMKDCTITKNCTIIIRNFQNKVGITYIQKTSFLKKMR